MRTARYLAIFVSLIFFLSGSVVHAKTSGDVVLKLGDVTNNRVEVSVSWLLVQDAPGYDLTVRYSGPIEFREFRPIDESCPAEVVSSFSDQVGLFCLMNPGQNLKRISTLGDLVFDVTGDGNVTINVVGADFGDQEILIEPISFQVTNGGVDTTGYLFKNITLADTIWWLAGICLMSLFLFTYLYLTTKKSNSRAGQLVMLGLIGVAVVTGTAAVMYSYGDNFDIREKAAPASCVPDCTKKQCGTDGCGGSCGTCQTDSTCSDDGICVVNEPGGTPDPMFACEVDSDCRIASSSCCTCNEGGDEIAINSEYYQKYRDDVLKCNSRILCPQVYKCTDAEAVCTNNVCVIAGSIPPTDPPEPSPVLIGDINSDGFVNLADYAIFLADYIEWKYELKLNMRSDLNSDKRISIADYVIFVEKYLDQRNKQNT